MRANIPLKIVSAYRGMGSYVEAARRGEGNLDELWLRHVLDPYWQEWAAGQFNEERTRAQMSRPITDLDGLAVEVDLLARSGVEGLIEEAYRRIAALLPPPTPDKIVCVHALDPADTGVSEKQNGVIGTCIGDSLLLTINPTAAGWWEWVPFVFAHEHHHNVWGQNYYGVRGHTSQDLLTSLLVEGQADSFASLLFPGLHPSWTAALTSQQEVEQWSALQPFLGRSDGVAYERFVFGEEATGTPWCTGYTIGFHIVQAYLRAHPGSTVLELLDKDAHEILAESGYRGAA